MAAASAKEAAALASPVYAVAAGSDEPGRSLCGLPMTVLQDYLTDPFRDDEEIIGDDEVLASASPFADSGFDDPLDGLVGSNPFVAMESAPLSRSVPAPAPQQQGLFLHHDQNHHVLHEAPHAPNPPGPGMMIKAEQHLDDARGHQQQQQQQRMPPLLGSVPPAPEGGPAPPLPSHRGAGGAHSKRVKLEQQHLQQQQQQQRVVSQQQQQQAMAPPMQHAGQQQGLPPAGVALGGVPPEDDDDDDDLGGGDPEMMMGAGGPAGGPGGANRPKTQAQIDRRRDRNRILARRTRLRKKFFFESLQQQVAELERENAMLKEIMRTHPALASEARAICRERSPAATAAHSSVLAESRARATELLTPTDFALMRLLQSASRSFCITDPSLEDNPIVYASQSFLSQTGYSLDQVVGRNCRFLQGPLTDRATVDRLRRAVSRGEDVAVTLLNYKADGTTFWNQLFIASLRDINERVVNFVGVQTEVPGPSPPPEAHAAGGGLQHPVEQLTTKIAGKYPPSSVIVPASPFASRLAPPPPPSPQTLQPTGGPPPPSDDDAAVCTARESPPTTTVMGAAAAAPPAAAPQHHHHAGGPSSTSSDAVMVNGDQQQASASGPTTGMTTTTTTEFHAAAAAAAPPPRDQQHTVGNGLASEARPPPEPPRSASDPSYAFPNGVPSDHPAANLLASPVFNQPSNN